MVNSDKRFCYRNIDKKCEINVPQDFFSCECFLLFYTTDINSTIITPATTTNASIV